MNESVGRILQTQAVIFDVDGTLVDSVDLHAAAWKLAFEHFGKNISIDEVTRQIGKGADQLMPVFLSQYELDRYGKELEEYRSELFQNCFFKRVKAFPKVRELFERIKRDGKKVVLASSAKQSELDVYKKTARIDDLVDAETSSEMVEKSKPHPDIFQSALTLIDNMSAKCVIAVGDTPYDAEAAGKANIPTIGLLCGAWDVDQLRRAGCIVTYSDPADLLARYDGSPLALRGS